MGKLHRRHSDPVTIVRSEEEIWEILKTTTVYLGSSLGIEKSRGAVQQRVGEGKQNVIRGALYGFDA